MANPNLRKFVNVCIYALLLAAAAFVMAVPATRKREAARKETASGEAEAPGDTLRKITMILGGDVMAHIPQVSAARRDATYDFAETFRYVKPIFDTTDFVIVNFETTVSATGAYSGYPLFSSPRELVSGLKESGVDAVMLANNHICDKGKKGIQTTVSVIRDSGLKYTGAFADSAGYRQRHPLFLETGGIKLAVLNYTYGTNGMPVPAGCVVNLIDTGRIAADIETIEAAGADFALAFFHWGMEYSHTAAPREKALVAWCHDRGIDIVVGSHPHMIQPVEVVADSSGAVTGITAYSLGNLVSNQRERKKDGGMLLRLELSLNAKDEHHIEAGYILTWTHVHSRDGRKYYHILPSPVADTLLKENTAAKRAYEVFADDSRKAIGPDLLEFGSDVRGKE